MADKSRAKRALPKGGSSTAPPKPAVQIPTDPTSITISVTDLYQQIGELQMQVSLLSRKLRGAHAELQKLRAEKAEEKPAAETAAASGD